MASSLLVELDRKALTTLGTTAGQDLAAVRGRHTGAKAMPTSTANATGLVCALHSETPEFKGLRPLRVRPAEVNKNTALYALVNGHP